MVMYLSARLALESLTFTGTPHPPAEQIAPTEEKCKRFDNDSLLHEQSDRNADSLFLSSDGVLS